MRVTLLGHASVLVELDATTVLMDPILSDPFEEGTVVSCPRRVIDVDRLPPIDIVVLSHRHPDHFDVSSLAALERNVDVICPADPLLVYALDRLGFPRVHPVHAMAPILGPDFELFPTRSETTSIPELGMVFRDPSGTFWNQVDTELADATIDEVVHHVGHVDVLFAMYASQNFDFFEDQTATFPTETHRRNLQTAMRIAPSTVVPASAGFRFCNEHEWLNAFLFPISRDRYLADLHRLAPGIDMCAVDPGDSLVIDADGEHAVEHHPASCDFVRTESDDTARLVFDPTTPIPPLRDRNPDGYSVPHLRTVTKRLLDEELASFTASRDVDRLLQEYVRHRVRYLVAVLFPDGEVEWRRYDFDGYATNPLAGRGELPPADMTHDITASALVAWVEHARSFFSVRIWSRRSSQVQELVRRGEHVDTQPVELPDLLMYYVLRVMPGADIAGRLEVDHQLAMLTGLTSRS